MGVGAAEAVAAGGGGGGAGLGDLIDTFSHLHTPLLISAERDVNGGVLGALLGALAVYVYRRLRI